MIVKLQKLLNECIVVSQILDKEDNSWVNEYTSWMAQAAQHI